MGRKRILYVSGSLGLGHIHRDLAIAKRLREIDPECDIEWLAAHPASSRLQEAGEAIVPEVAEYANDNIPAEEAAGEHNLNLLTYLMKARSGWSRNYEVVKRIIEKGFYDLLIGDETYEIAVGYGEHPGDKRIPYVMIYDFIGLDAMTKNPFERFGTYMWNRKWSLNYRKGMAPPFDLGLFIGEEEDVPDEPFGFGLPNRREWARSMCEFVGYTLHFDPADFSDPAKTRTELGYGTDPLIICTAGGTSVGGSLLQLCADMCAHIKFRLPEVNIVLVCGPRLDMSTLSVPDAIQVRGYVADLYRHFAACDLAIVQGGGTTTLELSALRKPFLYFPLENHFEQAHVSEVLSRHGAGTRMEFAKTTPHSLAEAALSAIDSKLNYADFPIHGAESAARLIHNLLRNPA